MKKNNAVQVHKAYRPRSITEARLTMSAIENDVFDILLTYVNREDDVPENLYYELNIADFKKDFGFAYERNAYNKIRNATLKLSDKSIEILDEQNKFVKFCLFQTVKWNEESKKVEIELGSYIKKLLVKEKYKSSTFYRIKYTLPMDSQYSKRLYIMFNEWLKTGIRYDSVETLRDKLQVPKSYKYNMFKQRVLDTSLKEINDSTDIYVTYSETKQPVRGGQKIIGLTFQIKKKECVTDWIEWDGAQMIINYLKSRNVSYITQKQAIVIYRVAQKGNLTDRQIINRINIVLEKKIIQNMVGYLIFSMSEKFETPKEVRIGFNNFSQRNYSKEWFALLEKSLLYPERMTDAEKLRYEELTAEANFI